MNIMGNIQQADNSHTTNMHAPMCCLDGNGASALPKGRSLLRAAG